MQFASNGRMNENSFKIALKSPNHLKQSNTQNGGLGGVPSTVTSTNPKTPSPSTNDVSLPTIDEFKNIIQNAIQHIRESTLLCTKYGKILLIWLLI